MNRQSKQYVRYIKSRAWQERRAYLFAMLPQKVCQRGGCAHPPIECHHLHYATLGSETLADVEFLCDEHHQLADREREKREARKRYLAGLDGYMTRRFGDDWEARYGQDEAERLYDAQIEKWKREK